MAPKRCVLCEASLTDEDGKLCADCLAMEHRLDFLILNHRATALTFIANKYNEANDSQSQVYDRRKTPYKPPPGMHTPDRRKKIRRVAYMGSHPKRRKVDQ